MNLKKMIKMINELDYLYIGPFSFITLFSHPFLNRQKQYALVANTAVFKAPILVPLSDFRGWLRVTMACKTGEPHVYMIFVVPDGFEWPTQITTKIKPIALYDFKVIYINITSFCAMLHNPKIILSNKIFVFCFFDNWNSVTKHVFETSVTLAKMPVVISGGDSSKRHLVSPLSLKLHTVLLGLLGGKLKDLEMNIVFNNIDKKFLTPQFKIEGWISQVAGSNPRHVDKRTLPSLLDNYDKLQHFAEMVKSFEDDAYSTPISPESVTSTGPEVTLTDSTSTIQSTDSDNITSNPTPNSSFDPHQKRNYHIDSYSPLSGLSVGAFSSSTVKMQKSVPNNTPNTTIVSLSTYHMWSHFPHWNFLFSLAVNLVYKFEELRYLKRDDEKKNFNLFLPCYSFIKNTTALHHPKKHQTIQKHGFSGLYNKSRPQFPNSRISGWKPMLSYPLNLGSRVFSRDFNDWDKYGSELWPKYDENDPFLGENEDSLYPLYLEDMESYSRYTNLPRDKQRKIKKMVYGLKGWHFVDDFEIKVSAGEELAPLYKLVYDKVKAALDSLEEDTIYKWIPIGIIDLDIKSAASSFFVSKKSSPENIARDFISYSTGLQMRYRDIGFTSWQMAQRKWIHKDKIKENFDTLITLTELENTKSASFLKGQKRHFPVYNSVDWISDETKKNCVFRAYDRIHIGKYGDPLGGGRYKFDLYDLVVKMKKSGVYLISLYKGGMLRERWVDTASKNPSSWTRFFPHYGILVYYEAGSYNHAEFRYKTPEWSHTPAEKEYDEKIGSLDIETFSQNDGFGLAIPYAAGFRKITGEQELFYLENNQDPTDMMCKMLDRLIQPENDGWLFYVHNLARFDSRFLLAALGKMGLKPRKLLGRAINQIFYISLTKQIGDKMVTVNLTDSLYILSASLDNLAKKFGTENKGVFPYSFVHANNLDYKGEIPPLNFYNKLDQAEYKKLASQYNANNPWSMKEETLRYLGQDLICLIKVMSTFNKSIFDKYQVNTTKVRSYSALSKLVYTTKFYKETGVKIPVIKGYVEKIIRRGYYGGLVDVVENLVQKAYKYDANSHYPAAMINDMPVGMPRITDEKDLNKLFGFSHAKVTAPSDNILKHPTLPFRDSSGVTTCPRGRFEGVWFTEELKDSITRGYQVEIVSTVAFERGKGLFDKFINNLFEAKAKAKELGDSVGEIVYKLLMNSFYGKCGQLEVENTYTMVENSKLEEFGIKHNYDLAQEFDKLTLVREKGKYHPQLLEVLNPKLKPNTPKKLPDQDKGGVKSCVAIAAAITAYARISLNRFKNIPGNKYLGGDTDSAILQKPLPSIFVGKQLGMMKFEDDISCGLYADKKLYYAVNSKGEENIKSRGVGKDFNRKDILQLPHFLLMLAGHVVTVNKSKFVINKKGAVEIKNVTLDTKIQKRTYKNLLAEFDGYLANDQHPKYHLARYIASLRNLTAAEQTLFVSRMRSSHFWEKFNLDDGKSFYQESQKSKYALTIYMPKYYELIPTQNEGCLSLEHPSSLRAPTTKRGPVFQDRCQSRKTRKDFSTKVAFSVTGSTTLSYPPPKRADEEPVSLHSHAPPANLSPDP